MSPDFNRNVYCVLGLPFDAVDTDGAVAHVRRAARDRQPCFLSTPNLNFAIAALADPAFRNSVVRSDLSIADGMPLVWVAKLMGVPLRERVAGSTVFNQLETTVDDTLDAVPLRVFFFGGPDGVAARASDALNQANHPAMVCVGHESPGFGTVEQMSSEACIARINATGADFVVVALGARKGQAWIEHNRSRLSAPVISHLGAVVNFVAGTIERAPLWVQRIGMEWAWRIKEEPSLWRRYAVDGLKFARLMLTRVFPGTVLRLVRQPTARQLEQASAALEGGPNTKHGLCLRLTGAWTRHNLDRLRPLLASAAQSPHGLHLDLTSTTHLDSAVMAQLSLLWAHGLDKARSWTVTDAPSPIRLAMRFSCADYLLRPVVAASASAADAAVAC